MKHSIERAFHCQSVNYIFVLMVFSSLSMGMGRSRTCANTDAPGDPRLIELFAKQYSSQCEFKGAKTTCKDPTGNFTLTTESACEDVNDGYPDVNGVPVYNGKKVANWVAVKSTISGEKRSVSASCTSLGYVPEAIERRAGTAEYVPKVIPNPYGGTMKMNDTVSSATYSIILKRDYWLVSSCPGDSKTLGRFHDLDFDTLHEDSEETWTSLDFMKHFPNEGNYRVTRLSGTKTNEEVSRTVEKNSLDTFEIDIQEKSKILIKHQDSEVYNYLGSDSEEKGTIAKAEATVREKKEGKWVERVEYSDLERVIYEGKAHNRYDGSIRISEKPTVWCNASNIGEKYHESFSNSGVNSVSGSLGFTLGVLSNNPTFPVPYSINYVSKSTSSNGTNFTLEGTKESTKLAKEIHGEVNKCIEQTNITGIAYPLPVLQ